MKNIALLTIVSVLLFSCNQETKTATSLDELKIEKELLKSKIDSLSSVLVSVESKISKLDTTKKFQTVTITQPKNETFKHYFEVQGTVKAEKNIEIRPELGGTVQRIYVKEGQKVSKGALLVQLDASSINNSITELKTQLNLAKTSFERQERLWNQKIGSEMQYLQAKAQKEGLENNLATLYTQARKMRLTAPFSGIVDEIFPKKGELTSPQSAVVRLLNIDKVYVEAELTETYLSDIKKGSEAVLNFSSIDKEINANISQVGNYINPDNRSFKVRINIPNKDNTIKPNLLADIKVLDFNKEGIIIPSSLVQVDQFGNNYVFAIEQKEGENIVVKKQVTVENEYNNQVFISEGITNDEKLVNEGARLIKAGETVTIK